MYLSYFPFKTIIFQSISQTYFLNNRCLMIFFPIFCPHMVPTYIRCCIFLHQTWQKAAVGPPQSTGEHSPRPAPALAAHLQPGLSGTMSPRLHSLERTESAPGVGRRQNPILLSLFAPLSNCRWKENP